MAQWDQRDPRWLVKELGSSGSNVNGWHWETRNRMAWSRARLAELVDQLQQPQLDPAVGSVRLQGLSDLTGEAYLTTRKGNKVLAVWDLALTLKWRGSLAGESSEVGGQLRITEFSLGNDPDEYEFHVTADREDAKHEPLLAAVRALQPQLLQLLATFASELSQQQQQQQQQQ